MTTYSQVNALHDYMNPAFRKMQWEKKPWKISESNPTLENVPLYVSLWPTMGCLCGIPLSLMIRHHSFLLWGMTIQCCYLLHLSNIPRQFCFDLSKYIWNGCTTIWYSSSVSRIINVYVSMVETHNILNEFCHCYIFYLFS